MCATKVGEGGAEGICTHEVVGVIFFMVTSGADPPHQD